MGQTCVYPTWMLLLEITELAKLFLPLRHFRLGDIDGITHVFAGSFQDGPADLLADPALGQRNHCGQLDHQIDDQRDADESVCDFVEFHDVYLHVLLIEASGSVSSFLLH